MATSSTKRAAKLAQKGKGQRIRFQGGFVFPLAVMITLIVGLATIVYARASVPAADASPPTVNDHWHAAYGFYLCDGWAQLNGNLEDRNSQGQLINTAFVRTGIHSHDDGVMHWHPTTSRATGRNAVLGVFLDSYDVKLTDDAIKFPSLDAVGPNPDYLDSAPSQILQEYVEGDTKCDGKDAEVAVKVWGSYTDTGSGKRYIANMTDVHIDNDGMVFGIYFTPKDVDQVMPPWASNLPELGALDSAQVSPDVTTLLRSDTTEPGSSVPSDTAPGSTLPGSVPTGTVPATSAPGAGVPPTTPATGTVPSDGSNTTDTAGTTVGTTDGG